MSAPAAEHSNTRHAQQWNTTQVRRSFARPLEFCFEAITLVWIASMIYWAVGEIWFEEYSDAHQSLWQLPPDGRNLRWQCSWSLMLAPVAGSAAYAAASLALRRRLHEHARRGLAMPAGLSDYELGEARADEQQTEEGCV